MVFFLSLRCPKEEFWLICILRYSKALAFLILDEQYKKKIFHSMENIAFSGHSEHKLKAGVCQFIIMVHYLFSPALLQVRYSNISLSLKCLFFHCGENWEVFKAHLSTKRFVLHRCSNIYTQKENTFTSG